MGWVKVRFVFGAEGQSPETFTWDRYAKLVDLLLDILKASGRDVSKGDVRPMTVKPGSADAAFLLQDTFEADLRACIGRTAKGIEPKQVAAVNALYGFVARQGGAKFAIGRRRPRVLPTAAAPVHHSVTEFTELDGEVVRFGGPKKTVEIQFEEGPTIVCGGELAPQFNEARMCYHRVRLWGDATRHPETGALIDFVILRFEDLGLPAPRGQHLTEEALANLNQLRRQLAGDGWSAAEHLKLVRGA